jgi:hypothetical protein
MYLRWLLWCTGMMRTFVTDLAQVPGDGEGGIVLHEEHREVLSGAEERVHVSVMDCVEGSSFVGPLPESSYFTRVRVPNQVESGEEDKSLLESSEEDELSSEDDEEDYVPRLYFKVNKGKGVIYWGMPDGTQEGTDWTKSVELAHRRGEVLVKRGQQPLWNMKVNGAWVGIYASALLRSTGLMRPADKVRMKPVGCVDPEEGVLDKKVASIPGSEDSGGNERRHPRVAGVDEETATSRLKDVEWALAEEAKEKVEANLLAQQARVEVIKRQNEANLSAQQARAEMIRCRGLELAERVKELTDAEGEDAVDGAQRARLDVIRHQSLELAGRAKEVADVEGVLEEAKKLAGVQSILMEAKACLLEATASIKRLEAAQAMNQSGEARKLRLEEAKASIERWKVAKELENNELVRWSMMLAARDRESVKDEKAAQEGKAAKEATKAQKRPRATKKKEVVAEGQEGKVAKEATKAQKKPKATKKKATELNDWKSWSW